MEPSDGPTDEIRIAIADEHPIFRDGLKHLLSLEPDFQVVAEVSHGDDVLLAVETQRPGILLLDLKMPGTDGLTILRRLQLAGNGVTKVIVLTASEDKSELVLAMKLGACGIILKQSPTDLLLKSIRKVHAGDSLDDRSAGVTAPLLPKRPYRPPMASELPPLSQTDREIVALVAQGFNNKKLVEDMFFSEQQRRGRTAIRELFRGGPRTPSHPIPADDSQILNRPRRQANEG